MTYCTRKLPNLKPMKLNDNPKARAIDKQQKGRHKNTQKKQTNNTKYKK